MPLPRQTPHLWVVRGALAGLASLTVAACARGGATGSGATHATPSAALDVPRPVGATPTPALSSLASMPTPSPGAHPPVADRAVAALAAEENLDPSDITVVSVEEVTWNDGSLGCPKPGMMYTQALIPGYRVVLEAEGTRYEYHADDRPDGTLVRCPAGKFGAADPNS